MPRLLRQARKKGRHGADVPETAERFSRCGAHVAVAVVEQRDQRTVRSGFADQPERQRPASASPPPTISEVAGPERYQAQGMRRGPGRFDRFAAQDTERLDQQRRGDPPVPPWD
jgi:hypothetical protein